MEQYFKDMFSCVDIFCGAGGLTYGFEQEGIQVNAGIDIDSFCLYPYSNNNNSVFIERNISEIEGDEIANLFTPETVWVLAGCAPCQPFSTYSQRYDVEMKSEWRLLADFERISEAILPDIITMENVPKIIHHHVFDHFIEVLRYLGYKTWHSIVDCSSYGVPQSRKRMVLLASLHGPIELIEPIKDDKIPNTVREAIGGLRPIAAGESDPEDPLHTCSSLSERNVARIRASKPGGTWRDWPDHLLADCHKADSGRSYPSVYGRMEWDKPAPTVTTQFYGYGNGRFGHPEQDRAISLREASILQGFPKDYNFFPPGQKVSFKRIGRLIGNAVPVDLGRAIAKSIILHLEGKTIIPFNSKQHKAT